LLLLHTTAPAAMASESPPPEETPAEAPEDGSGHSNGQSLPPLSDRDFRVYNRLAERMDQFVSLLRFKTTNLSDLKLTTYFSTAQSFPADMDAALGRL